MHFLTRRASRQENYEKEQAEKRLRDAQLSMEALQSDWVGVFAYYVLLIAVQTCATIPGHRICKSELNIFHKWAVTLVAIVDGRRKKDGDYSTK